MSATKNLIMTYEEMIGKDLDDFTDKDFLKIETTDILQNTALPCDPQTIEFFDAIYGSDNRTDLKRWIMVSDHNSQVNYGYTNQSDLIQAISALLPNEYNLFFTPALFFGWRTDAHAHYIRTIFIDIDGIDEYFPDMDDLQIKQWLIDTYRLPDQLLPNWVVASGHGLHLYYIVDELDLLDPSQSGLRKTYTGYLLTYFHGDIACRNPSHIMRVPGSYNIKRKPYPQTVLHHLNTDKNYEITRLDYFQTAADAVTAYQKAQQEEINAKRLETRKRNQLSKEEPTEPTDKTEEQPQENPAVETKDISPHTAIPPSIPKSIPEISCS